MIKSRNVTFKQLKALFQEVAEQQKDLVRRFQETDRQFKETDKKFQETDRQFKETDKKFQETDRQFKETDRQFKETDKKFQETDRQFKETDKKFQETDRKIGKLGSRLGDLIEHLAASNIVEKFQELGYSFTHTSRDHILKDERRRYAEIDILLENGEYALAVEVKSLFTLGDVKDHLKRMEILRAYAEGHEDKRRYIGAIAGALVNEGAKDFALTSGFYVIEQSGDTVRIKRPVQVKTW
ncbi:MAG: hypothetical protein LBD55_05100 [Treponema sp.]|jgi:hypothetical protein|nr:hypothetical protein [Treponema sp.]